MFFAQIFPLFPRNISQFPRYALFVVGKRHEKLAIVANTECIISDFPFTGEGNTKVIYQIRHLRGKNLRRNQGKELTGEMCTICPFGYFCCLSVKKSLSFFVNIVMGGEWRGVISTVYFGYYGRLLGN